MPLLAPTTKEQVEFVSKLQAMTDQELEAKTRDKIWLSAFAANNPRSASHWQCDACWDECQRRGKPLIYNRAWEKAAAQ